MLTTRLALPYLDSNQTQKHVTLNESLRRLDALVQTSVKSRNASSPPSNPEDGEAYILGAAPTGDWSHAAENDIAAFQDGAWVLFTPKDGWRAYVVDEGALVVFDGNAWAPVSAANAEPDMFGVNTAPDATNRFTLKSDAALFSHDDVTPGSGDMRIALNKASPAEVASLVFQSGWSGRAEFGLAGEDDFTVKVSADGSAFTDAIRIDRTNGRVELPNTPVADRRSVTITSGTGTYTVPAGVKSIAVTVVGGGGGGAGAETQSGTVFVGAGGGGAGGVVSKVIPTDQLASSYTYTVGIGGAGGAAASGDPIGSRDGSDGGESRFEGGALALVAGGGNGAAEDTAANGASEFLGGAGGAALGGDINISGQAGGGGLTRSGVYYQIGSGEGASGPFGTGGAYRNGNGIAATGHGAGGSGCLMIPGLTLNRSGGAGSDGIIIVDEFYG